MKTKLKTFSSLRSWSGRNLFSSLIQDVVRETTDFLVEDLERKSGALDKGIIFVCFTHFGKAHEIAITNGSITPFIRVLGETSSMVRHDGTPQGMIDALRSYLAPARIAA